MARLRRRATILLPLIVLVLFPVSPSIAVAQEFGQWSWDAVFGLYGRSRDNLSDAGDSRYDERNLGLSMGMNGFLLHPAISRFRLGVDLQFTDSDAGQSLDTNRIGLQGDLDLFPRGPYRGSLHFNRQRYDYAGAAADDPFTLLASPDTLQTYGGRFRAARGFLRGSLLGFENNRVDFTGSGTDDQIFQRQFYDWTRDAAGFSHHFRLERRYRDIGTVDVEYDDLRLNIDERGDFTPAWHWTLSGSGVQQESENFGLTRQRIDDYQLRTRVIHDVRERDLLEMAYEFGLTEPDTRASTESHGVAMAYKWRPNEMWHLGPTASYAQVKSDPETIRSPRAGVIAGWDWSDAGWDAGFVTRMSYGTVDRDMPGMSQKENQFSRSFIGRLGHGTAETLRKELELEVDSNRLRVTQTGLFPPPGLGLPLPGLGTEDVQRARVTLGHRWDSRSLNAWGDWNRRETAELLTGQDIVTETLTAALQYSARRFDLRANVSDSDVEQPLQNDQSIRSASAGAAWRPSPYLTVTGSYRLDDRKIALAPDIDGTQVELGVRLQIGLLYFDATFLEIDQRFAGGPETTTRSLTWTVTRRFGGWLPIVSGPGRRGFIR